MAGIAVVHLARYTNGTEPLREFVGSYVRNPGGVEHDLVVAFKSFDGGADQGAYDRELAGIKHRAVEVADVGMDIGAYRHVAETLDADRICLLNSFSVLLDPDWLAKLAAGLGPSIGAASASGSWESILDSWQRARPNKDVGPLERLKRRARLRQVAARFPPFPNPHLRTNALMIRSVDFLQLRFPRLRVKEDAQAFESGRRSLTRQLTERGLGFVVVGRDGIAYDPQDWPQSRTFRAGDQGNLLVADNRTRHYASATREERTRLAQLSWGALPGPAEGH